MKGESSLTRGYTAAHGPPARGEGGAPPEAATPPLGLGGREDAAEESGLALFATPPAAIRLPHLQGRRRKIGLVIQWNLPIEVPPRKGTKDTLLDLFLVA